MLPPNPQIDVVSFLTPSFMTPPIFSMALITVQYVLVYWLDDYLLHWTLGSMKAGALCVLFMNAFPVPRSVPGT